MPSAVAQVTVTGTSEAADRVTAKASGAWPVLPSLRLTAGAIEMRGSSSTMVPTPWPSAMVALVGLLRLTTKVSFGSGRRSPLTSTVIVPVVWPAGIVSVPEAAW